MADIFGREMLYGGSFKADEITLNVSGTGSDGLLVQNFNMTYRQDVTRLLELGTKKAYFVAARPTGQFSMGKVVGPTDIQAQFLSTFGDICNVESNVIALKYAAGWCGAGTGVGFNLKYCLLTSIGAQVQSADLIISEAVDGIFNSLETN